MLIFAMAMITTLALSDQWVIGMNVLNMIFSAVLAVGIFAMKNSVTRINRLEEEVKASARDTVDAQMNEMRSKVDLMLAGFGTRVDGILQRLEKGDQDFDRLKQRDHEQDMKTVVAIGNLREWIRENFATKSDIRDMEQRIENAMKERIARDA